MLSKRFELQDEPRWSSSGHDKSIQDSEFAGRLDFNQYTEGGITPPCPANMIAPISCLDFNQYTEGEYTRSEALLEVQSAVRLRDRRIIYLGALNSK